MSVDFAFIDSGTGGLPYMQYLCKMCPDASCVYVADAKNFPYGEKTSNQVIECAVELCKKVIDAFEPNVIVIACNTISVTALATLRKTFPTYFIGTVPAIKLASKVTHNNRIGLLATQRSISQEYTAKLIKDFASNCIVYSRADGKLISFIEHNLTNDSETEKLEACKPAVEYFCENDCDTIILGCTHFIHVADEIQKLAGSSVKVIDSRDGVVRQALKMRGSIEGKLPAGVANKTFFVTGFPSHMTNQDYQNIAKKFDIPWGGVI